LDFTIIAIFAVGKLIKRFIMCTVTLSYDQNNALARRKLAVLLDTGLFVELSKTSEEESREMKEHREEVEAFLAASKRSMSEVIARYL